jgi:hypothetical protein
MSNVKANVKEGYFNKAQSVKASNNNKAKSTRAGDQL